MARALEATAARSASVGTPAESRARHGPRSRSSAPGRPSAPARRSEPPRAELEALVAHAETAMRDARHGQRRRQRAARGRRGGAAPARRPAASSGRDPGGAADPRRGRRGRRARAAAPGGTPPAVGLAPAQPVSALRAVGDPGRRRRRGGRGARPPRRPRPHLVGRGLGGRRPAVGQPHHHREPRHPARPRHRHRRRPGRGHPRLLPQSRRGRRAGHRLPGPGRADGDAQLRDGTRLRHSPGAAAGPHRRRRPRPPCWCATGCSTRSSASWSPSRRRCSSPTGASPTSSAPHGPRSRTAWTRTRAIPDDAPRPSAPRRRGRPSAASTRCGSPTTPRSASRGPRTCPPRRSSVSRARATPSWPASPADRTGPPAPPRTTRTPPCRRTQDWREFDGLRHFCQWWRQRGRAHDYCHDHLPRHRRHRRDPLPVATAATRWPAPARPPRTATPPASGSTCSPSAPRPSRSPHKPMTTRPRRHTVNHTRFPSGPRAA